MNREPNNDAELNAQLQALRLRVAELDADMARLRSESQRDRMFAEAANEGLWAIDAQERTVHANSRMAQMLGTTVEALLGTSLFDFMDEAGIAQCLQNLERRRNGVSEQHDFVFVRRDGGRVHTSMRTSPIIDAAGVYQGSVALVADVTEQRASAAQLSLHKDEFRMIFDAAPAMIWFKDAENRILRVNQCAAAALGLSVAQIEGRSTLELFPEQAAAYHQDDLEVIRSNRPKLGITEPIVTASGEKRWILTNKVPCRNEHGDAVGVLVFSLDVTEAKRAEVALAASEERYRDLVETSQDLIWSVDAQGCWTFVNRAAAKRMYGREPEELLGHPFSEFESAEQKLKDLEVFERIKAGAAHFNYETVHLHKDGRPVHLNFNAMVLRDATGNVIGTTGTARDITERKRAEAEREDLSVRLVQAQKLESLGVLAGGIAHDFNNLLVGILGNAELALMDMPQDSLERQAIESVGVAARRAADLARQMLAYSGHGTFVVESVDISRVVNEMGHLLSAVISKKAELRIHAQVGLPAIEGDATQLRQVIMNLITNASDAIGENSGSISVTTGAMQADQDYLASTYINDDLKPGRYVFVEVSDTGCGMDAATTARIFEPFFTTKFPGRGLGLSAVLGILRGHNGAIRVHSEVGRGTTIRMLLPASVAPVQSAPRNHAGPQAADQASRCQGTVLVVDDEEMVRTVTKKVLVRAGFEVLTAADGRAALALFRERRAQIVVVLLDMTMPHLSGVETFQELRRIDPNVRVVLTSGYSEQEATQRLLGSGLAGFLQKPSTADEMIASLRAALA